MSTRKSRGDSSRKSEVVTVRLDPRLKYLAELAARRQRRPLSSYIEWAIAGSLDRVEAGIDPRQTESITFADEADALWDVDERDRFVKLALRYPDLLDLEEQRRWKLIRECGLLWRGHYGRPNNEWQWTISEEALIWDRLRKHWDTFSAVARGELAPSELPTWIKTKEEISDDGPEKNISDLDDEIPF